MPRKQRFKPSRKQPSQQQQQEPKQTQPVDADIETEIPARGKSEDSDIERSH